MHTFLFFFFFNDTATTEIYTLSLHDALPISARAARRRRVRVVPRLASVGAGRRVPHPAAALRRTADGARVHARGRPRRSEEHTSELQSQSNLVCRLLLEKKKKTRVVDRLVHI